MTEISLKLSDPNANINVDNSWCFPHKFPPIYQIVGNGFDRGGGTSVSKIWILKDIYKRVSYIQMLQLICNMKPCNNASRSIIAQLSESNATTVQI
jgi:hypothetical protein